MYSRLYTLAYLPLTYVARRSVRSHAFRRANRASQQRRTSALDPRETRFMSVFQASTVGIHLWYIVYTPKCGKKRTMRRSKPMEVKVVKLSAPHVLRVLSFPTPERTPRTTVNATKTRGVKEKYGNMFKAISRDYSAFNHRDASLRRSKRCNSTP